MGVVREQRGRHGMTSQGVQVHGSSGLKSIVDTIYTFHKS